MSGNRNVSVCRGHELANALYVVKTNEQSTVASKEEFHLKMLS